MKQLAAILLLGIFSFNISGYALVAPFLDSRANEKMELAFDENNYADNELSSITRPTNLPYYQHSKDFRRIDGEIEIAGGYYKYVTCRIYNETFEMLCIQNAGKMKILKAKADFPKMASDFQQTHSRKKSPSGSKSFQKKINEYEERQIANLAFNVKTSGLNYLLQNNLFVNTPFTKSVEQPPKRSFNNSLF